MSRFFILLILAACISARAADGYSSALEKTVQTRFGVLAVLEDKETGEQAVFLNKKKILNLDEYSNALWLSTPIEVGDKELVLAFQNSGGIACPETYVVIEVKEPVRVSKGFGNCGENYRTRVMGDTLEITMPAYVAHPDLMTRAEMRKAYKSRDVFVWTDGKIIHRKDHK